ncbi:MAG: SIS domain-containing protein [Rhodospirillales bacterium]|nr:SIS domain-containing protein [Rhodospirillales bacterium]
MTFPDNKFSDISAFASAYFEQCAAAQASVDGDRLKAAFALLDEACGRGATLYVCGNGGSAAISNHLVCDHSKCGQTDTDLRPKVVSLSTNIEMITAIANDLSYDEVFVYQLKTLAEPGDILLTISSSGDSENVVRAARWAKDNGLGVIAFTGFGGGRSADLADINLHVTGDNYGVVEDVHQGLMHILSQFLRQSHMNETVIPDRKF